MKTRREIIIDTIGDLFLDWLFYDRKEDEDLPRGAIEEAVEMGEITKQEILNQFVAHIEENFE